MAKLKVFVGHLNGGVFSEDGKPIRQARAIIATTSQKKAAEAAYTTTSHIRDYWSLTANNTHIRLAMQHPEKLIIIEDRYTDVPVVIDIVDCISDNWKRRKG